MWVLLLGVRVKTDQQQNHLKTLHTNCYRAQCIFEMLSQVKAFRHRLSENIAFAQA
ncbi:hypothetical protein TH47_09740 [Thalassospira sp. MCCC 1A02803]|nr:hypothetical protein TH47_09740 [Thalassospira sp. MCCC 1A02803]